MVMVECFLISLLVLLSINNVDKVTADSTTVGIALQQQQQSQQQKQYQEHDCFKKEDMPSTKATYPTTKTDLPLAVPTTPLQKEQQQQENDKEEDDKEKASILTKQQEQVCQDENNKNSKNNTILNNYVVAKTGKQQNKQKQQPTNQPSFLQAAQQAQREDSLNMQENDAANNNNNNIMMIGEGIDETGFYQSIRLETNNQDNGKTKGPILYETRSNYQDIQVLQSQAYGKILVLDGVVQLTERDADSYNEMMAHIPLFEHSNPQRVLIVGGGDGYVLHEVLKHASVQHVDHVDLDGKVVQVCQEHFTWGKNAWRDPRVNLHIADGAKFVKDAPEGSYDVIIQDSSDPWTWGPDGQPVQLPSAVLYEPEHFTALHRALKPGGMLNLQAETLNIPSDLEGIRTWRRQALGVGFAQARYGSLMISSYPTGQIGFLLCEKKRDEASRSNGNEDDTVEKMRQQRYQQMVKDGKATSYYHPPLQTSSFILPLWAQQYIYSDQEEDNAADSISG